MDFFQSFKITYTLKGICIHSNVSISEQLLFLHIINCVHISYFLILSAQIIGEIVQKKYIGICIKWYFDLPQLITEIKFFLMHT